MMSGREGKDECHDKHGMAWHGKHMVKSIGRSLVILYHKLPEARSYFMIRRGHPK